MNILVAQAAALRAEDYAETFSNHESAVRSYCRKFPAIFSTASNSTLCDTSGNYYIDFLSGAGSLNYGHNNPKIKEALLEYLRNDGITNSLDLHTAAKKDFIENFTRIILQSKGLNYRLQFTGPTGTNAVEAAMKLARKITGRTNIVAFSNAFHGMSLGALAASARNAKRASAGVSLTDITRMPYEGFLGDQVDTLDVLEKMLKTPGAGVDLPAAFIVESVQAEGGVNIASPQWLKRLAELASRHDILLILDEIQAGCGRTGTFFSFERAGIQPDLICLAKSISGYGLPMSLVLIKPELDVWQPGEHNGTFRGNNLAFVAATHALQYWENHSFIETLTEQSELVAETLAHWQARWPQMIKDIRGLGMIWGIELPDMETAQAISAQAYAAGLIVETCGPQDNVIKLLPPLTIGIQTLTDGLTRLHSAMDSISKHQQTLQSKENNMNNDAVACTSSSSVFDTDNRLIEQSLFDLTPVAHQQLITAQKRFSDALSTEGLNFEGKSYPVSIRPLILPNNTVEQLKIIGEGFASVFDHVAKIYVENESVRKLFPAYKNSEHLAFNLPNHSPLVRIFRLDGLFDSKGVYQILETNTDCPGGVIQNGLAGRLWADIDNPLLEGIQHSTDFQPFVADPDLFLKEILAAHLQRTGRPASRAAIVTFRGKFKNEVSQMVAGLNRLGVPTEEVDAADLKRRNGHLVDLQGRTIDVAYNKLDLRDLIDEPLVGEYLDAVNAGEVTFLNPLVSQWPLADKAIMALLSDPKTLSLLPAQDQALCKAHIPWTRVLLEDSSTDQDGQAVDLIDYVKKHRQHLILKPSNATRGEGLLVGPLATQEDWEASIQNALTGTSTFVVQQYIKGHTLSAVHPDIGVTERMWSGVDTYVYGGRFAGFQARASFDPVMNVGRKGILLPVIIVKEHAQ